ncbi:MAG TPA: hypothetical protein PLI18_06235 [Pirellulaceae bacterium]|nr:hypothetical protein [Pirellulaceae bacterium]
MRIIVGRTPLDFEAFISMERLAFRATCWLMLAIFGGTSAVGPFWHRHHDHAVGHESVSCSHGHFVAADEADEAFGACCDETAVVASCHDHDHAAGGEGSGASHGAETVLIAVSLDDDCAVCRFYASAASAALPVSTVLDRPAVAIAAPTDRSVELLSELRIAVRGPPLA